MEIINTFKQLSLNVFKIQYLFWLKKQIAKFIHVIAKTKLSAFSLIRLTFIVRAYSKQFQGLVPHNKFHLSKCEFKGHVRENLHCTNIIFLLY